MAVEEGKIASPGPPQAAARGGRRLPSRGRPKAEPINLIIAVYYENLCLLVEFQERGVHV